MLNTSKQSGSKGLDYEKRVEDVVSEVVEKAEVGELHPVIGNRVYSVLLEYLTPEYLMLEDTVRNNTGLRYELVKEVDEEKVVKGVLREYGNYFKNY